MQYSAGIIVAAMLGEANLDDVAHPFRDRTQIEGAPAGCRPWNR
jgi:hypothetical protein